MIPSLVGQELGEGAVRLPPAPTQPDSLNASAGLALGEGWCPPCSLAWSWRCPGRSRPPALWRWHLDRHSCFRTSSRGSAVRHGRAFEWLSVVNKWLLSKTAQNNFPLPTAAGLGVLRCEGRTAGEHLLGAGGPPLAAGSLLSSSGEAGLRLTRRRRWEQSREPGAVVSTAWWTDTATTGWTALGLEEILGTD